MKLIKYFTALLFVLVLSACSASDDFVVHQPSVAPVVAAGAATPPEVSPVVETPVAAPTLPIVDDIPVSETCNYWTYIPCRAYPPTCKAGYVLQQGLCTLSVCNYATYNPCAVPPPECTKDEELVWGICTPVVQACPQSSTSCSPSPATLPPDRVRPIVPNPAPTCIRDSNPLVLVNGVLTDNCGNTYGQVTG